MKDIFKAVNTKIKKAFPDITIQSRDVVEGFQRPSFYVDFEDVNDQLISSKFIQRTVDLTILFFPTDQNNYKIEVLEVLEGLKNEFVGSMIKTDTIKANILETESNLRDGVLAFDFSISYLASVNDGEDEMPNMEEIDLEMEE